MATINYTHIWDGYQIRSLRDTESPAFNPYEFALIQWIYNPISHRKNCVLIATLTFKDEAGRTFWRIESDNKILWNNSRLYTWVMKFIDMTSTEFDEKEE